MIQVQIWTDGACSGNPGPGGWGAILIAGTHQTERSGFEAQTTNNRMELRAVVEALRCLKFPCKIQLHSDSSYVIKAFNEHWLENWKRRAWMNAARQPVANRDLWMELDSLVQEHQVEWIWVKGHSTDERNNRADELARLAIRSQMGEAK